jgi:hypothetical protein
MMTAQLTNIPFFFLADLEATAQIGEQQQGQDRDPHRLFSSRARMAQFPMTKS